MGFQGRLVHHWACLTVVAKYMPHFRRALGSIVIGALRFLSDGVDTLHFSVRGELQDRLLAFLQTLKVEL